MKYTLFIIIVFASCRIAKLPNGVKWNDFKQTANIDFLGKIKFYDLNKKSTQNQYKLFIDSANGLKFFTEINRKHNLYCFKLYDDTLLVFNYYNSGLDTCLFGSNFMVIKWGSYHSKRNFNRLNANSNSACFDYGKELHSFGIKAYFFREKGYLEYYCFKGCNDTEDLFCKFKDLKNFNSAVFNDTTLFDKPVYKKFDDSIDRDGFKRSFVQKNFPLIF